jgi:hypothetical protein
MAERYTVGSVTTWRTYFVIDGKIVAERFSSGSTVTMQYFVLDHLGSVATIAAVNPTTGAVTTTQQAYDAWGKMRVAATGADDMTCSLPPASLSTRGFTNQEQRQVSALDYLDSFELGERVFRTCPTPVCWFLLKPMPNKVHGFSTDFGAEFCLCMPFGAERNKTRLAKARRNSAKNGGRDRD